MQIKYLAVYILKQVVPIYLIALLFFVFALELVEIVTNLIRYIQLETPIQDILRIQYYYLPNAVSFAIPIAMLFAVAFVLGTLNIHNELMALYSVGKSHLQLSIPILIFAFGVSVAGFFLQNNVVTESHRQYSLARNNILLTNVSEDNNLIAVYGVDGKDIYFAEYFNATDAILNNIVIVERDLLGNVERRIDANRAVWLETYWQLYDTDVYEWNASTGQVTHDSLGVVDAPNFRIPPQRFANSVRSIDELTMQQAQDYIFARYESGLPYREQLFKYYKRVAFSFTPLIVAVISCIFGGIVRKNILLLSMFLSLSATVVYYITDLVAELLAVNEYIPPFIAAWIAIGLILVVCAGIFQRYIRG